MSKNLIPIFSIITLVLLASCTGNNKTKETPEKGSGFDITNLDSSYRAQDDFYHFASGTWLSNNPVPPTESRWASFNELMENNKKILREILEESAADDKAQVGSNRKKVGDFYASGMDTAAIEAEGISSIQADLDMIAAISQKSDVVPVLGQLHTMFVTPLFEFFAEQDLKNNESVVPYLFQGGLGMPDRDYYLKDDSRSKEVREAYHKYISNLMILAGANEKDAIANAKTVIALETKLASASRGRVELRDSELNYNNHSLDDLNKLASSIDWKKYFESIGVSETDVIILNSDEFFVTLSNVYEKESLENLKVYFRYHYLASVAPYLGHEFRQADFDFHEGVLNGTEQMDERWKLVQETVNASMGEALGEVYCAKVFTPETKERMMELVNNLTEAFHGRIEQLDWMTSDTKTKALTKLNAIVRKIGYPDKWRDYSSLEISRNSYAANVKNAAVFEFKRNVDKIGKPVDKTEWGMSPQTVNAYYNPLINEIVFPAGILQPPFFDPKADDAINYGAIGSVIGHEMTHGFDDQGRQFDAEGNLKNWWSSEDSARFEEKAALLIAQYSEFTVNDSLRVNGEFTLGENIADLGGLAIAHDAYKRSLKGKQEPAPIDGFSADQRFFLGFAQVWRNNIRPEAAAKRILTDPHSPGMYRCNGVVSNMTEFYQAFEVKQGDKMHREETARAAIW